MVTTCACLASMMREPNLRSTALIWCSTSTSVTLPPLASALSFTSRDLGRQRVEPRCPEAAERIQPFVDISQRRPAHRVEPALTIGADRGESVVPQDLEVLRHRRLADRELLLD